MAPRIPIHDGVPAPRPRALRGGLRLGGPSPRGLRGHWSLIPPTGRPMERAAVSLGRDPSGGQRETERSEGRGWRPGRSPARRDQEGRGHPAPQQERDVLVTPRPLVTVLQTRRFGRWDSCPGPVSRNTGQGCLASADGAPSSGVRCPATPRLRDTEGTTGASRRFSGAPRPADPKRPQRAEVGCPRGLTLLTGLGVLDVGDGLRAQGPDRHPQLLAKGGGGNGTALGFQKDRPGCAQPWPRRLPTGAGLSWEGPGAPPTPKPLQPRQRPVSALPSFLTS